MISARGGSRRGPDADRFDGVVAAGVGELGRRVRWDLARAGHGPSGFTGADGHRGGSDFRRRRGPGGGGSGRTLIARRQAGSARGRCRGLRPGTGDGDLHVQLKADVADRAGVVPCPVKFGAKTGTWLGHGVSFRGQGMLCTGVSSSGGGFVARLLMFVRLGDLYPNVGAVWNSFCTVSISTAAKVKLSSKTGRIEGN